MKNPEHQRCPDGTRVRFTDEAKESMTKRPGITRPLPTPGNGVDAVYTINNSDDPHHDIVLRETGERWGINWLEALPTAEQEPDVAEQILQHGIDGIVEKLKRSRRALRDHQDRFETDRLGALRRLRALVDEAAVFAADTGRPMRIELDEVWDLSGSHDVPGHLKKWTPGPEAVERLLETGRLDHALDFDPTKHIDRNAVVDFDEIRSMPSGIYDPLKFAEQLRKAERSEEDLRYKPILQTPDQARRAFGVDESLLAHADERFVFRRMRKVEELLKMRRLGFTDTHPPIVTICGSTRFRAEMAEANRELTLAGCMVLAPGVFAHDGDEITEEQKAALDELHLRKIDLADEVLVVDPGGYVGESTRREIAYAENHGTPVAYLSQHSSEEETP